MSMSNSTCEAEQPFESVVSEILRPGSSLNPKFLAVLDAAFFLLLLVLLMLAYLSGWNIHLFVLIAVELALWASVKWFVYELQKIPQNSPSVASARKEE